ncbi:MAG: transcriptional regulator [Candidatus Nanohalarchaeota archaeon]|nr:MAG: transcriptional regulator [Candidatus Nanohaloarchaeota archaeon]
MLSKKIFDMNFKEALNSELKQRKMTISELSAKTKIPKATLYKITSGERDPRFSTVKKIINVIEPKRDRFIAIIATRFLLEHLENNEIEIDGRKYKIKEYYVNSFEEAVICAISAEKKGASGIICAPLIASVFEKIVDIPVATMKPKEDVIEKAVVDVVKKI